MRRFIPWCVAASLLFSGQSALAQSGGSKFEELSSLREEVVNALEAAANYGQDGDRSDACQSSRHALTALTQMDADVRFISEEVAGSDYNDDDRAGWEAEAEKLSTWISTEREVAMTDWQRTC